MKNLISICGVDGTGKSTLFDGMTERYPEIKLVRSPQFHWNNWASKELVDLSLIFDKLGRIGDQKNDMTIKSMGLFLSMTLSGWALREARSHFSGLTLIERDPIVDTMAYGKKYFSELKKLSGIPLTGLLMDTLREDDFERIDAWVNRVYRRIDFTGQGVGDFLNFLNMIFQKEEDSIAKTLSIIFESPRANHSIVLRISPDKLEERLSNSKTEETEIHEDPNWLIEIQKSYLDVLGTLNQNFTIFPIDNLNPEQLIVLTGEWIKKNKLEGYKEREVEVISILENNSPF